MKQLHGYIERITYQNPENGYTVAQLQEAKKKGLTCIVGKLSNVQPGETIRCSGEWKNHLIHGLQFEVQEWRVEAPSDVLGIKKYLGSGLIKGIGHRYAERIVDFFGSNTLNIIDTEPERLYEVEGIGKKRVELIKTCWEGQKTIRDVMVFLQTYEVSPSFAQKIYKTYGNKSIEVVKERPYSLARDIFGVGFKTADRLASQLGIAKDSPQRLDAGIEFVLLELADEGHVCHPVDVFIKIARETLEVDSGLLMERFSFLKEEGRIELLDLVYEGILKKFIWIKRLFNAEVGIAREVRLLQQSASYLRSVDTPKALEWVQTKLNIQLAEQQKQAVARALEEKLQIITGGPGTGKSTITKAILVITQKLTNKILLCAPTGKAAKRMTEITGWKASTIHSLLEFDFHVGSFKKNRNNPLDCDLLIVDEASMIDTSLMYSLLRAVPSHSRVILVGDINQLPSVGPGNVLRDLIASRYIPVTALTEIFRQAAGSRIVTNAHRINRGFAPEIANHSESDFFFMEAETPENVLQSLVALVTQRLPRKYGFNPFLDIQVLSPMKKGLIGTENLNIVLQEALNKNGNPIFRSGRKFLEGDKVMQLRNDYEREVFNGDVGIIQKIDGSQQQTAVLIDGREVIYDYSDLEELTLAYAVSVHKFQGSEYPCIVMPVHTTHFMMLQRNLLYTGVTRGKKIVVLIGSKKALHIAVKNDEVKKRYTGLSAALLETCTNHLSAFT